MVKSEYECNILGESWKIYTINLLWFVPNYINNGLVLWSWKVNSDRQADEKQKVIRKDTQVFSSDLKN